MKRKPSIRRSLMLRILAGTFVILLIINALLLFLIHFRMVRQFDHVLASKAAALATLTSLERDTLEIDLPGDYMPEFEDEEEGDYFQFFLNGETVVARSISLGQRNLQIELQSEDEYLYRNVELPDGRNGRMIQVRFQPEVEEQNEDEHEEEEGEEEEEEDEHEVIFALPEDMGPQVLSLTLVVAQSREKLDVVLVTTYAAIAGQTLLLLLGIGLLATGAVRTSLRPIEVMNEQMKGIGPNTLGARVQLNAPPEELSIIISTLNGLLDRLETAFQRERRFSSDVAHELRTPVAELRNACEVGSRWPDDPKMLQSFLDDAREIAWQMERIVTNLLELSRCEHGNVSVECEVVTLDEMVDACWKRGALVADDKDVTFVQEMDTGLQCWTDPSKLQMVLQNLIDNAVGYSTPEGRIWCSAKQEGQRVEFVLQNPTDDLEAEDVAHVFERFWQKDVARTDSNHAGLGMPIVEALCKLLDIRVQLALEDTNLFTVRLSLPTQIPSSS